MATTATRIVGPRDGKLGKLGGIGVRFMVGGAESGGGFALVEHPMEPRALAAPMHRHSREDEYSFVLEGRVGADLGGEIVYGEVGDLIFKPRGQWHTFWNAGDGPARILEIISPAGFEKFFDTMSEAAGRGELDPPSMVALAAEYGTEVDLNSVPRLLAAHGLTFAMGPSPE
ncbi:MAG TPA: cupin domain-containing protein [Candidatus Dormibacteraeota bacterium]|nr:cupin domain-containing protein [Candidatus Dormibacteraeota bacterium]